MQLRRLPRALTSAPLFSGPFTAARTRLQALAVWQQTGDLRYEDGRGP
jgi:hypothetical protein